MNFKEKYQKYKNKYNSIKKQVGGMHTRTFDINDNSITTEVLSNFLCPLTLEVMNNPVILSDGLSYERNHAESWLNGHDTSPTTRKLLPNKDIIPNHTLKAAIDQYKEIIHKKRLNIPMDSLDTQTFQVNEKNVTADILNDFVCSISFEIFRDPVVLSDGYSYERLNVTAWLNVNNTSPRTGAPLKNKNITPNHALRAAIEEYKNEIYKIELNKEIGDLECLAKSDDCCAQYQLGLKYYNGEGLVVKNVPKGLELIKLSSKNCLSSREYLQSSIFKDNFYKKGIELFNKKDYNDAVNILKDAVEHGHAQSQYALGVMFEKGLGVPKNEAEAMRLYKLAAEQDNADAQVNLAKMFENGIGASKNDAEAVRLYKLAVAQGNAEAQVYLGWKYNKGNGVQQNLAEAIRLYRLSAEQGNADAQNNLGKMFENGTGVQENYREAARLYRLAAQQGNVYGQFNFANACKNGRGVNQDYDMAVHYYELAAAQGHAGAQSNLGYMYEHGDGVHQNLGRAVHWYSIAVTQENASALANLGFMYMKGYGVDKNINMAMRLFQRAARQGHAGAQRNLRREGYGW